MEHNFINRLKEEKSELRIKVDKLTEFIETNPQFDLVEDIQRVLLVTQLNAMLMYLYTLEERIYHLDKK